MLFMHGEYIDARSLITVPVSRAVARHTCKAAASAGAQACKRLYALGSMAMYGAHAESAPLAASCRTWQMRTCEAQAKHDVDTIPSAP